MNGTNRHTLDNVSWYKQFWPWLLIGLLGVSVISSLVFVYIATSNQDPVVDGNYYKHGLTINEQLDNAASPQPSEQPSEQPAAPAQDANH